MIHVRFWRSICIYIWVVTVNQRNLSKNMRAIINYILQTKTTEKTQLNTGLSILLYHKYMTWWLYQLLYPKSILYSVIVAIFLGIKCSNMFRLESYALEKWWISSVVIYSWFKSAVIERERTNDSCGKYLAIMRICSFYITKQEQKKVNEQNFYLK
jgi:hypothetical protein